MNIKNFGRQVKKLFGDRRDLVYGTLFLAIAVSVVFYHFPDVPKNVALDELEFARLAHKLTAEPYTVYHRYATGHATLYFYILAAFFRMFGETVAALRLPAAIFGLGAAATLYAIFSKIFKSSGITIFSRTIPYAFIGAVLFATSRWNFQFSRFAFEASFLVFLELLSFYAFVRFIESKKTYRWLVASGVFSGLAFHSYIPGRLFIIVPLCGIFFLGRAKSIEKCVYLLVPFCIVISPLVGYLLHSPDVRIQQQLYWTNSALQLSEKISYFIDNCVKTVSMFFLRGDVNGRHNYPLKPALNPLIFSLTCVGLWSSLTKKGDIYVKLFFIYFLIALIPTVLTNPQENPNMLRTMTVIPSVLFFAVRGLNYILETSKRYSTITTVLSCACIILLIGSMIYEVRTYFVYQTTVFSESFEIHDGLKTIDKELPY